ncbi:MAG: hypothetical protein ILP19_02205 [Oscillospiraceae bacterium]|nr:hypothetical protein [Oscillospiraceae bacterium]
MDHTFRTLDVIVENDWDEYVETGWMDEVYTYNTTADAYDEVGAGAGTKDEPVRDYTPVINVIAAAIVILIVVVYAVTAAIKKKGKKDS